ncbi:class F sortase [Planococcus maitriensis]|uniref:Class F sortase n=1 Tax=Planococcus maitriensis TaxID=221799 RepID=A0A365K1Q8_9BACL|nr:class F sortase [Planococcus maitriensis]RAZ66458.1 class F sortase [Planococcus maitriensis]
MCGENDFNKFALLLAAVFLAGCTSAPQDEVSIRSAEVGFSAKAEAARSEQPKEAGEAKAAEKEKPAAEPKSKQAGNPINELNQPGIAPETLSIPSIGVEADVTHLGVTDTGEMAVPDNGEELSWFSPGYRPGQRGRSVIAGHVDDLDGPAVFWDLTELEPGDEIFVSGDDRELRFKVHTMESVPLDLADVDSVFGYHSSPELVLITCSGTYDYDRGTREERLIVYASLVQE